MPTTILNKEFIATLIKRRDPHSHKGDHGHALLIAGNTGRMGAAVLAARACLRTGVGLLTVNVPKEERLILQTAVPEAMLTMRSQEAMKKYNAVGIGPALGIEHDSRLLLQSILSGSPTPLVVDADALTLLANGDGTMANIPCGTIITPHVGEFDRLFGVCANADVRSGKALEMAATHSCIIVLKGSATLIATNGHSYTNTTGNAGLAKGGSGDVLTGMILALLAQGYPSLDAACIGVYLHGLAADIAVKEESMESLLATDVIAGIGKAFNFLRP